MSHCLPSKTTVENIHVRFVFSRKWRYTSSRPTKTYNTTEAILKSNLHVRDNGPMI